MTILNCNLWQVPWNAITRIIEIKLKTPPKNNCSQSFEIVIRGRRTSRERPLIGALGSGSRCCPGVTPDYSGTASSTSICWNVFGISHFWFVFLTFEFRPGDTPDYSRTAFSTSICWNIFSISENLYFSLLICISHFWILPWCNAGLLGNRLLRRSIWWNVFGISHF